MDYLDQDLGEGLDIVGRIPPSVVWDYIQKIMLNQLKEVLVLRLGEFRGHNSLDQGPGLWICINF